MRAMIFQQIVNEDAGCIAYLIGCGQAGEAVVVDPGRDRVDEYLAWSRRKGLQLTHILDTHIHADHLSGNQALLVTDLSRGEEPWFALTGDTLFVGDVGRPDFGGERAAALLYESLTTRVLTLPDSVEVYPAHGAGSSCGRAMSSKPGSTIGFERRFNPALQAATADAFVKELMTGLPPKPPNFDRIIAKNRSQALPSAGEGKKKRTPALPGRARRP